MRAQRPEISDEALSEGFENFNPEEAANIRAGSGIPNFQVRAKAAHSVSNTEPGESRGFRATSREGYEAVSDSSRNK